MEHIFQNLLCFMTTHCTALALYYSTWVNIRWHLSCSPSIVHMSSRGVQCTLQPPYLWFSNCLIAPCHLGASPGVFLIRILRSQLLPMDSFSLGQYQCVPLFPAHIPTEIPKNWAHVFTFELLKVLQAKFSAYFHVIVIHITCVWCSCQREMQMVRIYLHSLEVEVNYI